MRCYCRYELFHLEFKCNSKICFLLLGTAHQLRQILLIHSVQGSGHERAQNRRMLSMCKAAASGPIGHNIAALFGLTLKIIS